MQFFLTLSNIVLWKLNLVPMNVLGSFFISIWGLQALIYATVCGILTFYIQHNLDILIFILIVLWNVKRLYIKATYFAFGILTLFSY